MGFIEEETFRDANGRLLPGHGGLKPKGANNRLQSEIKNKITEFLSGELENLEDIYSEVGAKDKLRFIGELLSYVLPKSKEIIIEPTEKDKTDYTNWTTEDLRALSDLFFKYDPYLTIAELSGRKSAEVMRKHNENNQTK